MTTEQTQLGDGKPKPAGTWDYFGEFDPQWTSARTRWDTFSIGVFQWLPKSSGKSTKKGKIVKRFSGPVSDPQAVYGKAIRFIELYTKLTSES